MKRIIIITVFAFAALSCGCAYRESIGTNLIPDKVAEIKSPNPAVCATAADVRKLFGDPPLIENLGEGRERWTYLETRVGATTWLLISGYTVYRPTSLAIHSAALIVTLNNGSVEEVEYINDGE